MRIAISSIAWRADEEEPVRARLAELGVDAVEVVPGRVGAKPAELARAECERYRDLWRAWGIEIVAMQALLFGRGDLALFGTPEERRAFVDYLARIVRVGGWLGARVLVFGSPRNRLRGALDDAAVLAIARETFRALGEVAVEHGTCLCIEPNPPRYGADWIRSLAEARALVEAVAHPGFGLHVDAGALCLAHEGAEELAAAQGSIRHFHASEVDLAPLGSGRAALEVPHERYAAALRLQGYANVASIEMRAVEERASNLPRVEAAIEYARRVYGG